MNILYYKTIKLLCFMSLSLLSNLTFSQIQGEYESNKVNCIGSFQFKKASYYDYQINAQKSDSIYQKVSEGNKPEDLLTQKYSDFFLKSTPDERKEIILYSRIILEYNLSEYYYIKYALKDRKMTHKVAIFKKEERTPFYNLSFLAKEDTYMRTFTFNKTENKGWVTHSVLPMLRLSKGIAQKE